MTFILIIILAYIVTIYFRKKLIKKFSQTEKLIYYQLAVVLTLLGAIVVGVAAGLSDTYVFDGNGFGDGIAIISIIYFLFSIPKLHVDEKGRYILNTNDRDSS